MKVKRSLSCIVFLVLVQLITNAYSEDVGTQEVFESLQALGGDLTPSQNDIYSDTDSKIQDLISLKEKKVNEISGNEELEIATRDARESAMAIAIRAESEAKAAADRESQELTKRMVRESAERDALLLLERHTRESEQRVAQEAGMRKNPGSPDLEASSGSVQGSVEIYAQESADKPSKELAETEIPNELDEKEIRDSIAKDTRQSMMTAALEIPEKAAEKLAETEIMKSTNQAPGESDEEVVCKETQVVAEGEATKSTEEVATQSTDEVIGKLEEKEISVSVDMEGSESGVTDVNKFVSTDIEDTGVTLLGEVGSVMKELVEEELNIFREETATSSTSECANCETHEDEAMQEVVGALILQHILIISPRCKTV